MGKERWIPACAGMTIKKGGMTIKKGGMTIKKGAMTPRGGWHSIATDGL